MLFQLYLLWCCELCIQLWVDNLETRKPFCFGVVKLESQAAEVSKMMLARGMQSLLKGQQGLLVLSLLCYAHRVLPFKLQHRRLDWCGEVGEIQQ